MKKVVSGIVRFQESAYAARRKLFADLADRQQPEVLFITCADARIDPGLVTQTEPGELFICRVAGNIVPPHMRVAGGMTASIEYAVAVLGVRDIVVCGHNDCGAMKGALNPDALEGLNHVRDWLEHCRAAVEVVRACSNSEGGETDAELLRELTRQNVLLQLQHLRTHPAVAVGIAEMRLALHGWVYDIETGGVICYDEELGEFRPVAERYAGLLAGSARTQQPG